MNLKVSVTPRWYGPVPKRNGKELPPNQWARAGRRRKWTVRWRAIDGSRPRRTFDTRDAAEAFKDELVAEIVRDGPHASVGLTEITLGAFATEFQSLRIGPRGTRLSDGTMATVKPSLDRLCGMIGSHAPLANITKADIVRFVAELRNGNHSKRRRNGKVIGEKLSEGTINKIVATLKAVFSVAVNQLGYIRHNPFVGIRISKVAPVEKRYVTRDELFALLSAVGDIAPGRVWWEAFLAVCYSAGTRLNEAMMLTWSDVDFENDRIQVIAKRSGNGLQAWCPKDKDARSIPIPTFTVDALTAMQNDAPEGNPYVFIGRDRLDVIQARRADGTWADTRQAMNNVRRQWLRIVKGASIAHATIHDLRRSAITNWARRLPIHVVKELAGHSDIKTTQQFYLAVTERDMAEAREVSASALLVDPTWTQRGPRL